MLHTAGDASFVLIRVPDGERVRLALRVLQLGALAVVLAASTYKVFELDRYFVPKEVALHITASSWLREVTSEMTKLSRRPPPLFFMCGTARRVQRITEEVLRRR